MASLKKTTQKDINRPFKFFNWQLWTMFARALFYIGGHIMQMAETPQKGVAPAAVMKASPAMPNDSAPHRQVQVASSDRQRFYAPVAARRGLSGTGQSQ
jgi:hypothetical protein